VTAILLLGFFALNFRLTAASHFVRFPTENNSYLIVDYC